MSTTNKHNNKRKRFLGARFTTTLSIALVLFVIGLMAIGGLAAVRLTEVLREQFTVTITMSDSAPAGYGAKLANSLAKQSYAKSATYISADSAITVLSKELGENPEEFLGYNPLQPTVELQLASNYAVSDSISPIVNRLKSQGGPNVASIEYNRPLVDMVNHNLRKFALGLAVIAIILLLISITLIGNAVRMSMYADRFIINTMQLVGATNWFIRRPLIMQNIVYGLIASLIAIIAIVALIWGTMSQGAAEAIEDILLRPMPIIVLVCSVVIPGILIPLFAAWISAGKYLKHGIDDLYLM